MRLCLFDVCACYDEMTKYSEIPVFHTKLLRLGVVNADHNIYASLLALQDAEYMSLDQELFWFTLFKILITAQTQSVGAD